MVRLPASYPALDAFYILIKVIGAVALQLLDDVFIECIPGFLQKDLHNFRVKIFLEFCLRVVACREAIIQFVVVRAEHDDQINPAFWECVTSVPVNNGSTFPDFFFYRV